MTDLARELAELLDGLDRRAYLSRMFEGVRGGLPATSFSEGSPSADTPNVGLDAADYRTLLAVEEYRQTWRRAFDLLAAAALLADKERDRTLTKALRLLERCRVLESAVPPLHPMHGGEPKAYWAWHAEMARKNAGEKVKPGADCTACGKWVDNIGENRIKAGKCPACNQKEYRVRVRAAGNVPPDLGRICPA